MNGLINTGILRPELANSFAAGYKQAEEQRNLLAQQQQQRQLGDLQLQNALREQRLAGEEEAAYKAAGGDYATLQSELMRRGLGKQALAVGAQQVKSQGDRLALLKTTTELMKSAATNIMASPTLENAIGVVQAFGQRTGTNVSADIKRLTEIGNNPEGIKEWAAGHALSADKLLPNFQDFDLGGTRQRQGFNVVTGAPISKPTIFEKTVTPGEVLGAETTRRGQDIGATTAREGQGVTMRGQDIGAATAAAGQAITARGQDIGAATAAAGQAITKRGQELQDARERERIRLQGQSLGLEGRRVAVLEENQRRDADPAFQQRMANARVTGEAIAKGDVAALQALPKVITRAEEGLRLIDEMIGKQEVRDASGKVIQAATKPHPGFNDTVGTLWSVVARNIPGTDAADFRARFDQIKGASFLEAFESLKGGGAITEAEGIKATDAINRMSLAQSEKEFMSAARDLQEVVRKGVANAQRKAGGAGGAAAPTQPNIDALLQKYK
jgi:hypothetical protein